MHQPLTIWSTALHQKRPYLSLSDAVKAFEYIVKKDLFNNLVYNVVTENLTPQDILSVIQKHIPETKVRFTDSPIMNLLSYEVSRTRFEETGFEFTGSVDKDIHETVVWLGSAGGNHG